MLLALFLLRVRRGIDKTKIQLGANKNPLPKKNENPTTNILSTVSSSFDDSKNKSISPLH
jgi:hypothetical protein